MHSPILSRSCLRVVVLLATLLALPRATADQSSLLAGTWEMVRTGYDKNSNGLVDDNEAESLDQVTGGFDYLQLKPGGTCIYDRTIEFDGTWALKVQKNKKVLLVYPIGLPKTLPEEERDSAAFRYYLVSVDKASLALRPAHLGNTLLVYSKR